MLAACCLLHSSVVRGEDRRVTTAVNTGALHQPALAPLAIVLALRCAVGTDDSTCNGPFLALHGAVGTDDSTCNGPFLALRCAVGTDDSTCDGPFLAFWALHDLHPILADAAVGVQRLPHRR